MNKKAQGGPMWMLVVGIIALGIGIAFLIAHPQLVSRIFGFAPTIEDAARERCASLCLSWGRQAEKSWSEWLCTRTDTDWASYQGIVNISGQLFWCGSSEDPCYDLEDGDPKDMRNQGVKALNVPCPLPE